MSFFQLCFEMRGSIVPAIMPKIIFSVALGIFANLAMVLDLFGQNTDSIISLELGPFAALGVAISLFLGFHNNASYERWWEARKLWGTQVILVRDLARFLVGTMMDEEDSDTHDGQNHADFVQSSCTPKEPNLSRASTDMTFLSSASVNEQFDDIEANFNLNSSNSARQYKLQKNDPKTNTYSSWQAHIVYLSIAHTHAFRSQMRPSCKMDGVVNAAQDRDRFLSIQEIARVSRSKNPANAILFIASKILGKAHRSKTIDTYSMLHVQNILDKICEIQAACERIHNTSLPLAYSLLVHRTSVMYVLLVPFAIAPTVGWYTPLFTAIVAYTFFGLDQLAKEIQEPMMDRPMCIALSAMSRTCEIDALEALGEETPEFLRAGSRNCVM